mgnify:FL=1
MSSSACPPAAPAPSLGESESSPCPQLLVEASCLHTAQGRDFPELYFFTLQQGCMPRDGGGSSSSSGGGAGAGGDGGGHASPFVGRLVDMINREFRRQQGTALFQERTSVAQLLRKVRKGTFFPVAVRRKDQQPVGVCCALLVDRDRRIAKAGYFSIHEMYRGSGLDRSLGQIIRKELVRRGGCLVTRIQPPHPIHTLAHSH